MFMFVNVELRGCSDRFTSTKGDRTEGGRQAGREGGRQVGRKKKDQENEEEDERKQGGGGMERREERKKDAIGSTEGRSGEERGDEGGMDWAEKRKVKRKG